MHFVINLTEARALAQAEAADKDAEMCAFAHAYQQAAGFLNCIRLWIGVKDHRTTYRSKYFEHPP